LRAEEQPRERERERESLFQDLESVCGRF